MLLTEAEEADRESRAADQATPHHPPAAPQGSCVPVGGSSQRLFTAAGGASWGDALATRARSRLRALLDRLELLSLEQDAAAEEAARDALTLCTIHGSKGLEWPTVLVVRMNEGECPSSAALTADGGGGGTDEALEDERRLAYVAFSRAKARLILSFVATEPSGAPATPSRFLGEIPAALTVRDSQLR
mmetsp:Transcript_24355/g.78610  ORF Transcript_24355/g.78610 Transcript_24355/m.78610 type:complete len:188 (+) Transcript_24355:371-934(+)